jgi:hypothetical protein
MGTTNTPDDPPMCIVCGMRSCEPRYREGRDGREPRARDGKWRRRCAVCRKARLEADEGMTSVRLEAGRYDVNELLVASGAESKAALARAVGVSRDTVRVRVTRGLNAEEAERWAHAVGLDPRSVWT